MRPAGGDYLLSLEGRRVVASLDGRLLRGRLISIRDGFLTIEPDRGPRICLNKFELRSIQEDTPRVSHCRKVNRLFWR